MDFTIDTPIERAREILQDHEKVRYPDARLIAALNVAISEMQRVRPDIGTLWTSIDGFPYPNDALGNKFPLPVHGQYIGPLSLFIAGWAELADDEFTVDNRANTLLTRFTQQLAVGG